MMKYLKVNIGKRNLNRILSIMLLFLLVMQSLIVWGFGSFGSMVVKQQEEESVDYILKMYKTNLNKALNKIDNDLQDILSEQVTLQMLENNFDLHRWKASYKLTSILDEKQMAVEDVDAYVIYDKVYDTFLMSRSQNIAYEDLPGIETCLETLNKEKLINSGWTSVEIEGRGYLLKYYNYAGVLIAAMVSQQKVSQILSYGQERDNSIEFFVTNAEEAIICSSNPTWKYGQSIKDITASVLRKQQIMDGEYYVMGSIRYRGIGAQTHYFFIILFLMIVSVITLIFLRYFMNKEVISPVKALSMTSKKIHQGNLAVRPKYQCWNQEMMELKDTYVMMLDTIMDLKVQQYEKVIQAKDSELKYMHMQLKPHFFLNALSTINSMAYKHKNQDIHEFIQVFSQNIRYMFQAGLHTVPLHEEVEHVKKYLEMQRLLYKDSFYSYFEVPEELKRCQVPQMILHTFVENIFKHVIDINSFTTIFVVCCMELHDGEEMLKIEVQNTGKYFDEETLVRINDSNNKEKKEKGIRDGIGLLHTKEILSIMYGRENLLWIKNEEPEGAKVSVWIPQKAEWDFKET